MQIYEVTDPLFKEYGKIIDSVELTELLAEMKHTPVSEDVVYVSHFNFPNSSFTVG